MTSKKYRHQILYEFTTLTPEALELAPAEHDLQLQGALKGVEDFKLSYIAPPVPVAEPLVVGQVRRAAHDQLRRAHQIIYLELDTQWPTAWLVRVDQDGRMFGAPAGQPISEIEKWEVIVP